MRLDRYEVAGVLIFLALLFATLTPIAERARAGFAYFEIMRAL